MDSPRIEDLRRRIQKDPASIAFAQLAEEYRRAGRSAEAIEVCRAGLSHHPGYLSARVTLGRALLETGQLEQAEAELREVLRLAPENLAALRGIAESSARRGDDAAALAHYEMALALAPRDLELQHTVTALRERVRPAAAAPHVAAPPAPPPATVAPAQVPGSSPAPRIELTKSLGDQAAAAVPPAPEPAPDEAASLLPLLERWLAFIVEDRAHRSHQANG